MSNLSEEEIIDRVMMIDQWKVSGDIYTQDELNAIGELLDLYNKEKQLRKELIDDRDKYKNDLIKRIEYCNELEKDLFENCSNYVVSKDKIRKTIEEIKELLKQIDYHDIKDKNEREFYKKQYMQYVVARNILQGLLEDNI